MKYGLSFELILGIIILQKCFSDFGGLTYGLKKIYKIERTQAVLSVPLIGALFLMQREDKNGN